ncbi:hypothetical protein ACIBF1_30185 [Spirillospora sp. NPDC050679]
MKDLARIALETGATGATAAHAAPVHTAAPTSSGSVKVHSIHNDGGNAVRLTGSVRCTTTDTITLDIQVSQAGNGSNAPAPYGKTSAKVACNPTIENRTVRVPILRDGPVTPGRMMVVATTMRNSAGKQIHSDRALGPIQN